MIEEGIWEGELPLKAFCKSYTETLLQKLPKIYIYRERERKRRLKEVII